MGSRSGQASDKWDTHEAEARNAGSNHPLVARLVRVLDYDDLGRGGGPVVELDGVRTVLIGGGPTKVSRREAAAASEAVCGPIIDMRVEDRFMSQSHVRIDIANDDNGTMHIEDVGSRNGTWLDGKPLTQRTRLEDGAWFEAGHTIFMMRRVPRSSPLEVQIGPTKSYSPLLASMAERLDRLAGSLVPLVIAGPTGSGKEVVAQHVHEQSKRKGSFVGVNCGAIVGTLLESELFGHLRGAFTGATADRRGYVEAAHRGTLFLDEVSELSLAAQVRLLRVLELGEVVRVGGVTPLRVDLRILSASNRDLEDLADEGAFRPDLYARLAGYVIVLPALAQRKEDIGELVAHWVRAAGRATNASIEVTAGRALFADDWALNARGLRRAIESALVLAEDRPIQLDDLPARLRAKSAKESDDEVSRESSQELPRVPVTLSAVDEQLRDEVVSALDAEGGNVTRAAARMGKHRQQFQRWMRRLGIDRSAPKPDRQE